MLAPGRRIATIRARVIDHPKHSRWLLMVTLVGMFSTSFPSTILSVSIKPIAVDLHSSPGTITWVTTAPMLAAAVCTPVLGRLGDLRGHRRIYLLGLLTAQGYVNAYAGVTVPNPGSEGLHRALGFEPVGVYRRVGFKNGAWHDVLWLHRPLADPLLSLVVATALTVDTALKQDDR